MEPEHCACFWECLGDHVALHSGCVCVCAHVLVRVRVRVYLEAKETMVETGD